MGEIGGESVDGLRKENRRERRYFATQKSKRRWKRD